MVFTSNNLNSERFSDIMYDQSGKVSTLSVHYGFEPKFYICINVNNQYSTDLKNRHSYTDG